MGAGSFPGVKSGRGVTLTPHPLSSAVVKKVQSYTSTPRMDRTACTKPQCLYKGARYFYVGSVQYVVSLFASPCYFIITRLMFVFSFCKFV